MNKSKRILLLIAFVTAGNASFAQFNESGISAGFFDSSNEKDINFSEFHLPPLSVLLENAKATPTILSLEKARQIAQAEVAKQRRHIFSYFRGHASYSYGKTDMWGNNSSNTSPMVYQFQGSTQNYWNVGANLNIPLEDILDLGAAVKRKKLEVDLAVIKKDIAYDELKLQISSLFVKITNNLVTLKTLGETAATYQGAGALNREDFENGNMAIEAFAYTKLRESSQVTAYQNLQSEITTDILTLEILTHTPIITNSTTEVTLDSHVVKSEKQMIKENKAIEKRIKKASKKENRRERKLLKAEAKAEKAAIKAATKQQK